MHPEIITRQDALLLDIRNGVRALCRRLSAGWDGPEFAPLTDAWMDDLLEQALRRGTSPEPLPLEED